MVDTSLQATEFTGLNRSSYIQGLYNQYAAKLLGYIFEVVKNMSVAEQYLIAVFKDVPQELDKLSKPDVNSFCHLQIMARKKLADFFDSVDDCAVVEKAQPTVVANTNNKYLTLMSADERLVFCGIYWHGKTVAKLAAELERTEDAIRKILKDCFTTIRSSR